MTTPGRRTDMDARRPVRPVLSSPHPQREDAMAAHGSFTWNELMTRDVEAAKRFYGDCLGWRWEPWPMDDGGTYWVAHNDAGAVGGLMDMSGDAFAALPPHWFAYIAVDDVDARVAKAIDTGGVVVRPPFDIPEVGRIGIVQDPTGAVVGWMTEVER